MGKRFTDTDKWRKGFVRSLDAPYKLLWLYILDECDHAGIWHVELDVANVRLGSSISSEDALSVFGERVVSFDDGEKWFIPDFISFQYGNLSENNRMHQSVIRQLDRYGLSKGHASPFQGAKDKDKDKDKEQEEKRESKTYSSNFNTFWSTYPKKNNKKAAYSEWKKATDKPDIGTIIAKLTEQIEAKQKLKQAGEFTPEFQDPQRWIKNERWNDVPEVVQTTTTKIKYDG